MKEWTYRHYVADSLRMNPSGQAYTLSLREMLKPQKMDLRTADDIKDELTLNAGIIWED